MIDYNTLTIPQPYIDSLLSLKRRDFINQYYKLNDLFPNEDEILNITFSDEELNNIKHRYYVNCLSKITTKNDETIFPEENLPSNDNVITTSSNWITFSEKSGNLPAIITVTMEENNGYDRYFLLHIDRRFSAETNGYVGTQEFHNECNLLLLQKGKLGSINTNKIPDSEKVTYGEYKHYDLYIENLIFDYNITNFTIRMEGYDDFIIKNGNFSIGVGQTYTGL